MTWRQWAAVVLIVAAAVCVKSADARAYALDGGRKVLAAASLPVPSHGAGATARASCRSLPAGIRQQESRGRYDARGVAVASHGGARALGAYQVMPANLPGWSLDVVGRRVSEREFMASSALQDRIAGTKLRQLCARYGPRGAAAAWYSGRPERANDPTPVRNGPSVKAYVDSVMALAGRFGK